MKYVTLITFALFTIIAQGCVVEIDQPNPETEADNPVNPNEPAPAPDGPSDDGDDWHIENPIAPAPEPEEWDDEEDDGLIGVHPEDDDEDGDAGDDLGGEDEGGDAALPEGFGEGEGEEEDEEEVEIRGACEPGQDQCDPGFTCEQTCEPSYCDDEGNCTQDCRIGYACMGNDPVAR